MIAKTIFGDLPQPEGYPKAHLTSLYTKDQLVCMCHTPPTKKEKQVVKDYEHMTIIIRVSDKKSTYNKPLYEYWVQYKEDYLATLKPTV